jgi:hypothetical protein
MLPSRTSGNNPEPQATIREHKTTNRKSKANVTITRGETLDAQQPCCLREPQATIQNLRQQKEPQVTNQ